MNAVTFTGHVVSDYHVGNTQPAKIAVSQDYYSKVKEEWVQRDPFFISFWPSEELRKGQYLMLTGRLSVVFNERDGVQYQNLAVTFPKFYRLEKRRKAEENVTEPF